MITLEHDRLVFRFPEVHENATCSISFKSTFRIPDDGKSYPLPPGVDSFPLRHLDDFAANVPENWRTRGGVIMPMHQAEAMWINFYFTPYPFAVKIATGKRCAITGEQWVNSLNQDPQDYAVIPEQPWIDGYNIGKDTIRQFVAMPLGDGYSAEEQLTGEAEHGGIQILVYPMKASHYAEIRRKAEKRGGFDPDTCMQSVNFDMGLAPGGRMEQEIYEDKYGLDAWDLRHSSRCFVSIANSLMWLKTTGEQPPTTPPTAADYTDQGLPWFSYYGGDAKALEGSGTLAKLKTVAETGKSKQETPFTEDDPVDVKNIINLGQQGANVVRETEF